MTIIERNQKALKELIVKGFPKLQKGSLENICPGDFYLFKGNLYLVTTETRDNSFTVVVKYKCKKSVAPELLALLNECSSDPIVFERERQMTQGECEMLYDAIRYHYNPEYDKIMVDAGKRFFF